MNTTGDMLAAWEHISKDIERVKIGIHGLKYSKDIEDKALVEQCMNSINTIKMSLQYILTGDIRDKRQD